MKRDLEQASLVERELNAMDDAARRKDQMAAKAYSMVREKLEDADATVANMPSIVRQVLNVYRPAAINLGICAALRLAWNPAGAFAGKCPFAEVTRSFMNGVSGLYGYADIAQDEDRDQAKPDRELTDKLEIFIRAYLEELGKRERRDGHIPAYYMPDW